jgi:hypothetical protein
MAAANPLREGLARRQHRPITRCQHLLRRPRRYPAGIPAFDYLGAIEQAFGYNRGPTQTIPLLSGSPAIDAGNPSGCTDDQGNLLTTDQRGMPRPDPGDTDGCNMGAYESQSG